MKKKLLSMILATAFILSGCGSGAEAGSVATVTETAATREVSISEESEEPVAKLEETEKVDEDDEDIVKETVEETEEIAVSQEEPKEQEPEAEEVVPEQSEQESTLVENEPAPAPAPAPAPESAPTPHSCTWDAGIVTANANCNSEGTKTFKCTGCGSTRNESIAKTAHNYVTESIPATCTEDGKSKTYCSVCGNVQSEGVGEAAKGHTPGEKLYWPKVEGPNCAGPANYSISCSVCGEHQESGTDPALPHTEVQTVIRQATCNSHGTASIDCSVCGSHLRNEKLVPTNNHNWLPIEYDVFNMETLEWEKVPGEYCTVCNRQK